MSEFKYRAKDRTGKIIAAVIQAQSEKEAIERICQAGQYPLSVDLVAGATGSTRAERPMSLMDMMNARKNVTDFTRQLANLLKSGIPILNALGIVIDQCESPYFRSVLQHVFGEIRDGKKFSEVLAKYPGLFDAFYISMVRVGEDNGTLPDVMARLIEYRRKYDEIRGKIKGALAYPALVACVGFATVLYIVTQVLPKFLTLIENTRMKLPPVTAGLLKVVTFLHTYFAVFAIGLGILYIALINLYRLPKSRLMIDRLLLRLPVCGRLILESEMVKFSRTLITSLESGLHILISLELACSVLSNRVLVAELERCVDDVRNGMSLGLRMKMAKVFPSMVAGMIAVGEESGRLTEMLGQIADDYEWRVNETIRAIMVLIEPAIILVLGAIVGFIVVALLLPLFQMDALAR
ncbi:MAG: type II secretion system F family protein [Candidatus Omnitrophica bacterium]|nr:type II secretion system F family protein [Candidatus Omnitrophota bacterium]